MKRRVVVTGMGIISPLGCNLNTVWERATSGVSGIRRISTFDTTDYASQIAGEVVDFKAEDYECLDRKSIRHMDPFTYFGMAASELAVKDSGIDFTSVDTERCGVVIGSGIGGLHVLQEMGINLAQTGNKRFSPFMIPQMLTNILAGHVAIKYGLKGPNYCVVSACASAAHSLGESLRMIQHGEADLFLAGGAESAINELGVGGFARMRALCSHFNDRPTEGSRPFDAGRCGFVIGEGAATLMIEEYEHAKRRGAKIYCELAGYGRTCDAHHMTAPDEFGRGAARAMTLAMADAGVTPAQVDYINAHGTSTPLNDKCETLAIKGALGDEHARRVAISSTKSMTGHLLGAAAGVESVFCVKAIETGVIPPTLNYTTPDPDCDLNYTPNVKAERPVKVVLNNSLGFGGHNACLCFKAV